MTVTKLMTAEELWALPEVSGKRFELVNGELIEVPGAGYLHGLIAGVLYRLMFEFATVHKLGVVQHDGISYVLRRNPDLVRTPDASFVSMDRIPPGRISEGFFDGHPDIAVEVVSPNDLAGEVEAKVGECLSAGVRLVWVIWPSLESVTVHTPDRLSRSIVHGDTLDGGEVLPGFAVPVSTLFAIDPRA